MSKVYIFNGKKSSQPKYDIPKWKTVKGSLKQKKLLVLYKEKKIEKCL